MYRSPQFAKNIESKLKRPRRVVPGPEVGGKTDGKFICKPDLSQLLMFSRLARLLSNPK